ncbi:MAG: N-acetyltransferase family protein [Bacteroidia bacterium]
MNTAAPHDDIEACCPGDYEKIASIYNEYITLGGATMEERVYDAAMIAKWVSAFNQREKLYVLRKDGAVIGWGILKRYSDREGYRFACETAIYITASELRKGYGSRMKVFLIEQCKSFGYKHLVAKIFASNTSSIEYNLSLGYTIVGRQEKIGFRNDQWQDIVIMQYLID